MSSLRIFAGLSIETGIPDRTTIMNFRHLLERHGLARQILEEINRWLSDAGVLLKEGDPDGCHYH